MRRPRAAGPTPERLAAGRALLAVEQGVHADRALDAACRPHHRTAATWHLLGVLRRRGALDRALAVAAGRSPGSLDPPVRAALRLGAHELAAGRPPHAAVDQAVRLVRALGAPRAAGLVNAVLRRLPPPPDDDPWVNHPEWLVARWRARHGEVAAAARCRADDRPPRTAVALCGPAPPGFAPMASTVGGRRVPAVAWGPRRGAPPTWPGFEEGRWWVMDPASAAVADLLAVPGVRRVLDCCAAPGGKTARLLASGMEVAAWDRSPDRLARLAANLDRLGLRPLEVRAVDLLGDGVPRERYEGVLLDAPCTGLGTLRRHPEIRWRVQPGDPAARGVVQRRMLERAARLVGPGGVLVYAVCSPEPEEGEAVVEDFLERHPSFRAEARLDSFGDAEVDAFQAVRLRRTEGTP